MKVEYRWIYDVPSQKFEQEYEGYVVQCVPSVPIGMGILDGDGGGGSFGVDFVLGLTSIITTITKTNAERVTVERS
jgi:hypothetical protein